MVLITCQTASFCSHFIACAGLVDGRTRFGKLMFGKYFLKYLAPYFDRPISVQMNKLAKLILNSGLSYFGSIVISFFNTHKGRA